MDPTNTPTIPASQNLPELTLKVLVLAVLLAIVLAVSNAYLALKIGILTSASIPAAVLSMGILRFFKQSNILENNLVQTAASSGEAVAGGIVYTIPALIIIHYWFGFSYWENVVIALLGGLLGVLFSIPLRRVLVSDPRLAFPEGVAIAEVLKVQVTRSIGLFSLIVGGSLGALIELGQMGFKILANSWQVWFVAQRTLMGFGAGFSATLLGAGYLIGISLCSSIFIGALIGWGLGVPLLSEWFPGYVHTNGNAVQMVMGLWGEKVRYIGIGAMLFAGLWTLITLIKPFWVSLQTSIKSLGGGKEKLNAIPRTERDIPLTFVMWGIAGLMLASVIFFYHEFPLAATGLSGGLQWSLLLTGLAYILVFGFIFSAITAYFSGMVGVTASPGSAIIIAGMLIAGLLLMVFLGWAEGAALTSKRLLAAEAITIMLGAVITGAAAISNDNIQDLKVGYLVGATPWKQQIMLMLGVVVSAFVIPPVMQLLFNVYGIADVVPRAGMDLTQTLPAPPAAVMAAIAQAVFHRQLPWTLFWIGAAIILVFIVINHFLKNTQYRLSILGIAFGIYLPLASSIPLFIGGLMALFAESHQPSNTGKQRGKLLACGLVAGAALMDVGLAIPFSIFHSPDPLRIVGADWKNIGIILSFIVTLGLGIGFYRTVHKKD